MSWIGGDVVLVRFAVCGALLFLIAGDAARLYGIDIVWTDSTTGQILRGPADGGAMAQILYEASDYPNAPAAVSPFGIAVDENFLYWSDSTTGQILRGSLDGLGPATVLFDGGDYPGAPTLVGPAGLSVDQTHVYWVDSATGEVLRGLKDGAGSAVSLFGAADYPGSPTDTYPWDVVVTGGNVYWSDSDTSQILVGAADGSSAVQALFTSAPERVHLGLAIDGDNIYWGDTDNEHLDGTVMRGSITGTGSPEILYGPADYPGSTPFAVPIEIAAKGGQLYWIDSLTKQLLTAGADGTGPVSVMFDADSYPGSPAQIGPTFLALVDTAYNADFDADGDVDGRDFLAWQRGQSPAPQSAADLALWQAQYGSTGVLAAVQYVPEPSCLIMAGVGASVLALVRRPTRNNVSR